MKLVKDLTYFQHLLEKTVLTNGCFDLLHPGHIHFLTKAKSQGDSLIVAINSNESVRKLKGPRRPIMPEWDRLELVAALEMVDYCFLFNDLRCDQIIRAVRPRVWIKGGDYSLQTLNAEEVAAAREVGAEIRIIPFVPGYSSTGLIARIQKLK